MNAPDPFFFIRHIADRAGLAAELARELGESTNPVRRNCAFCGRERSQADDNHAPDCPYWDLLGGRDNQAESL